MKSFRLGNGEFEHKAATVKFPPRPESPDLEYPPFVFQLEKTSVVDARGRFLAAVAHLQNAAPQHPAQFSDRLSGLGDQIT